MCMLAYLGMSHETLKWKLFLFSLTGRAKHWYTRTIGSVQGDSEALCSSFCLSFFPISRVVSLRIEVMSFKQREKESLGVAWARFNDLVNSGPDLAIQDHTLLQHFYMGLSGELHSFLTQLLEVPSYIALLVKGEKSLEES